MSRIYLVDDHAIVRDGLRAMLQSSGHQVVGESADLTVALGEMLRLQPELLLLDLNLDGRSGLELLDALRRRAFPVRTLVLTMSAQPHDVAQALQLGAAGYLLKDSSREQLLGAIDTVLSGRPHLDADVAGLAAQARQAGPDDAQLLAALSPRERQIIVMVVKGHTSLEIGTQLHLSSKTVDTYRSRLMAKLGVGDVTALVRLAIRAGLIDSQRA